MTKASDVTSGNRYRLLLLGFALLINIAVISVAISYQEQFRSLSGWVDHTRTVSKLLREAQLMLIDAETGLRGYSSTHDTAYAAPFDQASASLPGNIASLRKLTVDNPEQQASLDILSPLIDQEMSLLHDWRDRISAGTASPADVNRDIHDGKVLMDQLRQRLATMSSLEEDLYTQRLAKAAAAATQAKLFLILGSIIALVLICVIFYLMQREMMVRRRSEESLSVTLGSIGDGVIATDNTGKVTRFNRAAEQLTGWQAAEAIGRPIGEVFNIINEQTRAPAVIPVAEVLQTGKIVGLANHTVLIARNGHEVAIADSCAPIHGPRGNPLGAVLVFRDVTEDREADAAIRKWNETLERRVDERTAALHGSEERFSTFMDASPVIAWIKDENGRYQYMNQACCDIFGLAKDGWQDKTEFDLTTSDHAVIWRNNDREVLLSGKPLDVTEEVIDRKGQARSLKSIKFPFRGIAGERCVGGVAIDITRQTQIESQLRQAQKMEAVGQLTGGLAHDFNNLLAVIIGNLDYVGDKLATENSVRAGIEEALAAALRGAELTRQLLSFSRQQSLQPQLLSIAPLVEGISKLLKRTLGEMIDIKLDLPADLWAINADPSMLESALMNLAVNARDAMPSGGTLKIMANNCHLDDDNIDLNPEMQVGDYVQLSVSDTGAGMSPDVISRAFDPFFTTKAVGHGTGLGLSMVHGFVKQSGGNVKIYSEIGHGTAINLYLPRADRANAVDKANIVVPIKAGAGETILVVEDNPAVRQLVEKQLSQLGYRVITATDGQAAMSILLDGRPIDLLFTDVVMAGGMSGPDLAREARKHIPGLRVLFSSGFPRDAGRDIEPNFDDSLLTKPYRRADLANKVREILNAG
jgi:PAS domain S-box-containing protein